MKSSDKDMVMFRNSRKGYDKSDVNRYIEDMNIRFTTAENHYVSTIRMLERDLDAARSEPIKAEALQKELEKLKEEIGELKSELARAEDGLAEAREQAEALAEKQAEYETRNDAAPATSELSVQQAESALGSIIVKANLDAQRIVAEAEAEAQRKIAEAEAKAEAIRFDAAVAARVMAENAKKELTSLTEEYMRELAALSEESAGEYRRVSEDMRARLAVAEAQAKAKLNGNA